MAILLTSTDEFIAIRNFMSAEGGLGFSGIKLQVYALIYQFSEGRAGEYHASLNYAATRIGTTKKNASKAIQDLLAEGFIEQIGAQKQSYSARSTKKYGVCAARAEEAKRIFLIYWHMMAAYDDAVNHLEFDASRSRFVEEAQSSDISLESPQNTDNFAGGVKTTPPNICSSSGKPLNRDYIGQKHLKSPGGVKTTPPNICSSSSKPLTRDYVGQKQQKNLPDTKTKPASSGIRGCQNDAPGGVVLTPNNTSMRQISSIPPIPSSPKTQGVDGASPRIENNPETTQHIKTLMDRSLNHHAPFAEVATAYKLALDAGYTPELIAKGYEKYVERYRRKNPDTAEFAIRLSNYLTRGDGLRFDIQLKKQISKPVASQAKVRAEAVQREQEYLERFEDYRCARQAIPALLKDRIAALQGNSAPRTLQDIDVAIANAQERLSAIAARHLEERGAVNDR